MSTDLVAPTRIWRQAKSLVRNLSDRSLSVRSPRPTRSTQETGMWSTLLQTEQSRKARDLFGEQCNEIFTLVLAIEGAHLAPTPEEIDLKLAPHFREMERVGTQIGLSDVDLGHVQYALIALIDEAVLHSGIQNRSEWESRPLQFVRFGDRGAGEEFFRRLDAVRRGSRRKEVLSVFFLCLALGFEGKYRLGSADELVTLRRMLSQDLHGSESVRPSELYVSGARRVPAVSRWAVTPVKTATGLLVLLTGLYGGLRVDLRHRVSRAFLPVATGGSVASTEDDLNPLAAIFSRKNGGKESGQERANNKTGQKGNDNAALVVEAPVIHSYIGGGPAAIAKPEMITGAAVSPQKRALPLRRRAALSPVTPVSQRKVVGSVKPPAGAAPAGKVERSAKRERLEADKAEPVEKAQPAAKVRPSQPSHKEEPATDRGNDRDIEKDTDGDIDDESDESMQERMESWR